MEFCKGFAEEGGAQAGWEDPDQRALGPGRRPTPSGWGAECWLAHASSSLRWPWGGLEALIRPRRISSSALHTSLHYGMAGWRPWGLRDRHAAGDAETAGPQESGDDAGKGVSASGTACMEPAGQGQLPPGAQPAPEVEWHPPPAPLCPAVSGAGSRLPESNAEAAEPTPLRF